MRNDILSLQTIIQDKENIESLTQDVNENITQINDNQIYHINNITSSSLTDIFDDIKIFFNIDDINEKIPIWACILIMCYIFLSIVYTCYMYNKFKKYYSKTEWENSSCFSSKNSKHSKSSLNMNLLEKMNVEDIEDIEKNENKLKKIENKTNDSQINTSVEAKNNLHDEDKKPENNQQNDNDQENENDPDADWKFPEFKRFDIKKINVLRIFICCLILWWFRIIVLVICLLLLCIAFIITSCCKVQKNPVEKMSKCRYYVTYITVQIIINPMFWLLGYITCYRKKRCQKTKEIYEKYLGSDYDINNENRKWSCFISNHLSWFECFYYGLKHSPGFIAKASIADNFVMGIILGSLSCQLVKREDKDSRHTTAENLVKRQEMFYNKETASPLMIFPEGTTTNGNYLLKFKHGAFLSLLPVKPIFCFNDQEEYGLADAPMTTLDHFFHSFSFLWRVVYFYELPVIECTDCMIKNFKKDDEKECDTFARIAQNIYLEIFDLKYSEVGFKELKKYEKLVRNR